MNLELSPNTTGALTAWKKKSWGLYACGMSQRNIADQIKSLYDVEISLELVSKISEKIMPQVTAWQNHPLEVVYPLVFMDAIHYAVYVVLGHSHGRRRSGESYNTANIIEGLNRRFRKVTKNKPSFTNDDSLRKMLYLASRKIVERWTVSCRNWDMVLNQLNILFADQFPA